MLDAGITGHPAIGLYTGRRAVVEPMFHPVANPTRRWERVGAAVAR